MKKILSSIFIFFLVSSCYSQNSLVVYVFKENKARSLDIINESKINESSMKITTKEIEDLNPQKVNSSYPSSSNLVEVDKNDIIVLAFKNDSNVYSTFVENKIIRDISIVRIVNLDNADKPFNSDPVFGEEYMGIFKIFKVSDFKNIKNGNRFSISIEYKDSNKTATKPLYVIYHKDIEFYGIGGFWLPIGLNSVDIKGISDPDSVFSLTTAPVSVAWGLQYIPSAISDFYIGITGFINYSVRSVEDRSIVGNVSLGAFIDIANYFYVGWSLNVKRKDDTHLVNGPLIGFGPNLLNLIKGKK